MGHIAAAQQHPTSAHNSSADPTSTSSSTLVFLESYKPGAAPLSKASNTPKTSTAARCALSPRQRRFSSLLASSVPPRSSSTLASATPATCHLSASLRL
ncbi:hypothetical protein AB1N83_013994 [Pleurotus pulmonarius]